MDRYESCNRLSRTFLGFNNFITLASAAIVTGLLAYLLARRHVGGTHPIFQLVIVSI